MLVILTSRLAQILEWLKHVAGYRIVESNWELTDGVDTWHLTANPPKLWQQQQSADALVAIFPRLAQWLQSDDNPSFLWISSFNASCKEELHRAVMTVDDAIDQILVTGIFYGQAKSLSCRATTGQVPTGLPCDNLPRYKSYRLRKARLTVDQNLHSHRSLLSTGRTVRTIYLSRHGESEFNVLGKVGGDANLSERGQLYADCLGKYVNEHLIDDSKVSATSPPFRVWTSTLKRTIQTARWILAPQERFPQLNELGSGVCDGLTYEEIAARYPAEFAARDADKFLYRYPGGESYADLLQRVQPVLKRLESTENVLIIAHQAVIRCLLAALLAKENQELPYIHTPLHTIMRVSFTDGHDKRPQLEMIPLSVECVDTHRARPTNVSLNRSLEEALVTVPAHYTSIGTSSLFTEPEKANVDLTF